MKLLRTRSNGRAKVKVTPRDRSVFLFLWLWKVSTTAAIWRKFFTENAIHTAYRRLWALKRAKYIDLNSYGDGNRIWALGRPAYQIIREELPCIKEDGFRSEHVRHDHLVSAFQFGDYLVDRPNVVTFITEQQLRRYSRESLPAWVPETETDRPDGFTRVVLVNENRIIAIEVELNRKSSDDYRALGRYYGNHPEISDVFWVVPNHSTGNWIKNAIVKSQRSSDIHQFVLLNEFLQNGWDARINIGQKAGFQVRNFFQYSNLHTGHTQPTHTLHPCVTHHLLDTRIKLRNTATYEQDLKSRFCN